MLHQTKEVHGIAKMLPVKSIKVAAGGKLIGTQGNFFQPTVLTDVPESARIMNEEPFGPVAVMLRFKETDDVLERANKLPFMPAPPDTYYEKVDARVPGHGESLDKLRASGVLIDGEGVVDGGAYRVAYQRVADLAADVPDHSLFQLLVAGPVTGRRVVHRWISRLMVVSSAASNRCTS